MLGGCTSDSWSPFSQIAPICYIMLLLIKILWKRQPVSGTIAAWIQMYPSSGEAEIIKFPPSATLWTHHLTRYSGCESHTFCLYTCCLLITRFWHFVSFSLPYSHLIVFVIERQGHFCGNCYWHMYENLGDQYGDKVVGDMRKKPSLVREIWVTICFSPF